MSTAPFQVQSVLGEGALGNVYKCVEVGGIKPFAVLKSVKKKKKTACPCPDHETSVGFPQ